jgi:hypothetical protein
MLYRYWLQRHPNWPAKLRDLDGQQVRLVREIKTRGGDVYRQGDVMTVSSTYRGRLVLRKSPDGPICIRGVYLRDVELMS